MIITALVLAIVAGISLGLIGSGGSILTVPILVYILHLSPGNATTYSLFIVGVSTLLGTAKGAYDKLLDYKMLLYVGVPGILSIFIMRKYLIPMLPHDLMTIFNFTVTRDFFTMVLFAILVIRASFSMIHSAPLKNGTSIRVTELIAKGAFAGLLSGFVGVGGGFLIIPALIFSAGMPMKKAVATSLPIISFNSLTGFSSSLNSDVIDWEFLLRFTGFTVTGVLIGMIFSKKIHSEKLKPVFGWFVLITGIGIIMKELTGY